MGRRGKEKAVVAGRKKVLQIGSLSRHQPTENNPREDTDGVLSVGKTSGTARGIDLLGAYRASDEEEEGGGGEIDNQVADFLKELKEDDGDAVQSGYAVDSNAAVAETPPAGMDAAADVSLWQECLDPNSGHVYYWNRATNEVTWMLPEALQQNSAKTKKKGKTKKEEAVQAPVAEAGPAEAKEGSSDVQPVQSLVSYDSNMFDDGNTFQEDASVHSNSPNTAGEIPHPTATTGNGDDDSECNFEHHDDSDCNVEQYDSDQEPLVADEEGGQSAKNSPPPSKPSSLHSSPQHASEMFEDDDSDCNIVNYDDDETEPAWIDGSESAKSPDRSSPVQKNTPVSEAETDDLRANGTSQRRESSIAGNTDRSGRKRHVEGIDFDLVPYDDKEIADVLFSDPHTAIKLGYEHVLKGGTDSSPNSSGAEEAGSKSKSRSVQKASASLALPPRAVRLSQARTKPSMVGKSLKKENVTVDEVKKEKPHNNEVDMFAEESESKKMDFTKETKTQVKSNESGATEEVDIFDVDAVLEESLASAMSRSSDTTAMTAAKRPAEQEDTVADEPQAKRAKAEPASTTGSSTPADDSIDESKLVVESNGNVDTASDNIDASDVKPCLAPTGENEPAEEGEILPPSSPVSALEVARQQAKKRVEDDKIRDEILALATDVSQKLKFLNISTKEFSNLHITLVQVETRLADWRAGALESRYAICMLREAVYELVRYEQACAPPGWKCIWDSSHQRYYYHNEATGTTTWDYPAEASAAAPMMMDASLAMGLHPDTALMFAGAMAAYGTPMYPAQMLPQPSVLMPPAMAQDSNPPLPAEEPPPPPPGVDEPPAPEQAEQPPLPPEDVPPPLPPGMEDDPPPPPPPESQEGIPEQPEHPLPSEQSVVIAAPATITARPVSKEPSPEPQPAQASSFTTEDPLRTRLRATLIARGLSETEIDEYFKQQALVAVAQQPSSQPSSPKTDDGQQKPKKKKDKVLAKDKTKKPASAGLLPTKKKKTMSALVEKWSSIRQQELEEDEESEEDDPAVMQLRKIEEWKARQMVSGGSSNANFEAVRGDWRERVRRAKQGNTAT